MILVWRCPFHEQQLLESSTMATLDQNWQEHNLSSTTSFKTHSSPNPHHPEHHYALESLVRANLSRSTPVFVWRRSQEPLRPVLRCWRVMVNIAEDRRLLLSTVTHKAFQQHRYTLAERIFRRIALEKWGLYWIGPHQNCFPSPLPSLIILSRSSIVDQTNPTYAQHVIRSLFTTRGRVVPSLPSPTLNSFLYLSYSSKVYMWSKLSLSPLQDQM